MHRSWLGKLVIALAFGRADGGALVPARARKHLNTPIRQARVMVGAKPQQLHW
jgi:hypothetical protein